MRQSQLFAETQKVAPKDEKSINAQFLIRAGFVDKLMAGVYSYLPLGWRVLRKIENIVRTEMQKIGGQEVLLPALHPKENWLKTNRWQNEEMFKIRSRSGKDFSLGWTHEEIITPLVKKFVKSHKDLPLSVYQIQDKFRDELRVKSGLLRGLEFIMKDLYSFHKDEEDLDKYYEKVKKAYFQIFKRCAISEQTFLTLASGGTFSKYSHEFQTVTPYGEDKIYLCPKCKLAVNEEIIREEKYQCSKCQNKKLEIKKAIEVGNIFKLKNKFSRVFDFTFVDKTGEQRPILMGCYGIGLPRLMGAIVEVHHDEKGICWPKEAAPFQIHLIPLAETSSRLPERSEGREMNEVQRTAPRLASRGSAIGNTPRVKKITEKLYQDLQEEGIEVLYDDRENKTAGEKFADCDLIGIPLRIVVSERTLKNNSLELKQREKKEIKLVKINKIKNHVE